MAAPSVLTAVGWFDGPAGSTETLAELTGASVKSRDAATVPVAVTPDAARAVLSPAVPETPMASAIVAASSVLLPCTSMPVEHEEAARRREARRWRVAWSQASWPFTARSVSPS